MDKRVTKKKKATIFVIIGDDKEWPNGKQAKIWDLAKGPLWRITVEIRDRCPGAHP